MRLSFVLAFLMAFVTWSDLQAKEIFKKGHFTVRKVEGTCKLEILLHKSDREPAAILALFPSDDYYGELFTEKPRIGLARGKVSVSFDRDKAQSIPFVPDAAAKDSYWRWQYLETTQGLLVNVRRKNNMTISFSNGKRKFKYSVSLKGSSRAVKALQRCR